VFALLRVHTYCEIIFLKGKKIVPCFSGKIFAKKLFHSVVSRSETGSSESLKGSLSCPSCPRALKKHRKNNAKDAKDAFTQLRCAKLNYAQKKFASVHNFTQEGEKDF
jgi:hypothetical protein